MDQGKEIESKINSRFVLTSVPDICFTPVIPNNDKSQKKTTVFCKAAGLGELSMQNVN